MNSLSPHTRAFTTGASIGLGGTRAADIRKLRKVLSELDYLNSPPKTALSYTPAVADAIGRFQEDFGLKQDGLITPDGPTEQALNLAIAANRTGDRTAFDLARTAVAHLNGQGFALTRDRSNFDALGAWRNRSGERIEPGQIVSAMRKFRPDGNQPLTEAGTNLISGIIGDQSTQTLGLKPTGSSANTTASSNSGATLPSTNPKPNAHPQRGPAATVPNATQSTQRPKSHKQNRRPKNFTSPENLMRVYRQRYVEGWKREGKTQASENMKHYLDGSGKPMRFTRDQARAFEPIRALEQRVQKHFENLEFVGKTERNDHLNRQLKNLKDGKSISGNGNNNAEIGAGASFGQYLGNETDFVLAFGRTKLNSEADFTAARQGNTIHIQGIVTHKWEDTYNFEKGQIGAAGAHRLEKEMGAKPFPMGAAWQQNFSGTVSIKNGVLSNPKITWTDK